MLGLAGGAVAAGFLIEEVEVQCLVTVGAGEDCPAGQVFRETADRPYLGVALGVAAGVAVIGAIEAFVKARGRDAELGPLGASAGGSPGLAAQAVTGASDPAPGDLRLGWPSVTQRGVRVDFNVLRLTF